jgi:hypothetical protein
MQDSTDELTRDVSLRGALNVRSGEGDVAAVMALQFGG